MKTIVETLWVMAFVLFWMVVLPVAGLVEIGIAMSDKVDRMTDRAGCERCGCTRESNTSRNVDDERCGCTSRSKR